MRKGYGEIWHLVLYCNRICSVFNMASVTLEDVRKVYPNNHLAVDGISFSVDDGEFLVLVGPSGCGKSSTLRMLAGLESVTEGNILIEDQMVNDIPSKDRDVAMVFQNYALYPHMTVYNNMAFGLKLRKYSKHEIKERVGQAADILGITDILQRKPKQLSGGQQQRVAVGRAIVRKPKVFLFDEPLSNLDAKLRVQMRTELARLHRQLNATIIYVTHDQTEAMTLGDRIVVMNEGTIQQIDTPVNLYHHPMNLFVAEFIGNPAMNFLSGEITKMDGRWSFVSSNQEFILPINEVQKDIQDGHQVVLGIRPEHLAPSPTATDELNSGILKAEVIFEEHLGCESYVHTKTNSSTLLARVAGTSHYGNSTQLHFEINHQHSHLFDAMSGQRIIHGHAKK